MFGAELSLNIPSSVDDLRDPTAAQSSDFAMPKLKSEPLDLKVIPEYFSMSTNINVHRLSRLPLLECL